MRHYKTRDLFTIECCDCKGPVTTNSYRTLRCISCSKSADYRRNMLDYKWRLSKLIAMAKNRAKEKKLPFNLSKQFMIDLWEKQKGTCPISHRSFDLESSGVFGQVNPNAPSIDRINPKLGYVEGNVRIVIYHVNVAISEFGLDIFQKLIKDINVKESS